MCDTTCTVFTCKHRECEVNDGEHFYQTKNKATLRSHHRTLYLHKCCIGPNGEPLSTPCNQEFTFSKWITKSSSTKLISKSAKQFPCSHAGCACSIHCKACMLTPNPYPDIESRPSPVELPLRQRLEEHLRHLNHDLVPNQAPRISSVNSVLLSSGVVTAANSTDQVVLPVKHIALAAIDFSATVIQPTAGQQIRLNIFKRAIQEYEEFFNVFFAIETYEDAIKYLNLNEGFAKELLLDPKIQPLLEQNNHTELLSALLAFKDKLGISDGAWSDVRETFSLGPHCSINAVRLMRKMKDGERKYTVSSSGVSVSNDATDLLTYMIRLEKPKSSKVVCKISMDAGRMKREQEEEVCIAEIISVDKSTSALKSEKNGHLISLILGQNRKKGEDVENIETLRREELKNWIKFMNDLAYHRNLGSVWMVLCTR